MFSYVFMKILERRPRSYDRRMNRLTAGRTRRIKQQVADLLPADARVLEIGCGAGELASVLLIGGATVHGFDRNPDMVSAARERVAEAGLADRFTVQHMGVDGMDTLKESTYDAVVATLVMSELSDDERSYALCQSHRVLKPGGVIVLADEVWPLSPGRRLVHHLSRAPLAAVTYLVSTATTRPLRDLPGDLTRAGFSVEREQRSHGGAFTVVSAHRAADGAVT